MPFGAVKAYREGYGAEKEAEEQAKKKEAEEQAKKKEAEEQAKKEIIDVDWEEEEQEEQGYDPRFDDSPAVRLYFAR